MTLQTPPGTIDSQELLVFMMLAAENQTRSPGWGFSIWTSGLPWIYGSLVPGNKTAGVQTQENLSVDQMLPAPGLQPPRAAVMLIHLPDSSLSAWPLGYGP